MHRFFLPSNAIQGDLIHFPPDIAHQICRVLRLRSGEIVVCLDNQGGEYTVELSDIDPSQVSGRILQRHSVTGEPDVKLHMLLCLSQREKFEWMLQKCTEVGVSEFTPLLTSRTLVQDAHSIQNKLLRWQKIITEAAEQSGRGKIPRLNPTVRIDNGLSQAISRNDLCLLAWEEERSQRLSQAFDGHHKAAAVAILIGPEGGLSPEEVEQAISAGWKPVSLGRRILRMETAAVVSAALTVDWFDSRPD